MPSFVHCFKRKVGGHTAISCSTEPQGLNGRRLYVRQRLLTPAANLVPDIEPDQAPYEGRTSYIGTGSERGLRANVKESTPVQDDVSGLPADPAVTAQDDVLHVILDPGFRYSDKGVQPLPNARRGHGLGEIARLSEIHQLFRGLHPAEHNAEGVTLLCPAKQAGHVAIPFPGLDRSARYSLGRLAGREEHPFYG